MHVRPKLIAVGQKLAAGDTSMAVPLSALSGILPCLKHSNTQTLRAMEAMTEAEIRRDGGRGGQEVRSWMAAFAALERNG